LRLFAVLSLADRERGSGFVFLAIGVEVLAYSLAPGQRGEPTARCRREGGLQAGAKHHYGKKP